MSNQCLPSIRSVTDGLVPCSRVGCPKVFPLGPELFDHEKECNLPISHSTRPSPPSLVPIRGYQPYPIRTHLDVPSSGSSVTSDSEDSPTLMTPGNSRASSVCDPWGRRDSGGVMRTERRGRHRSSASGNCDAAKKTKKMEKEKQNRQDQGAVLYRFEDYARLYVGWTRNEQSGGNGNGAGVFASKINLLRGQEQLLYHLLHRERCLAIQRDCVDDFEAKICGILDNATGQYAHDPYHHTFLDGEDIKCQHEPGAKSCSVHGLPDWRECRRAQTQQRFEQNEAAYRRAWLQHVQRQRANVDSSLSRPGTSSSRRS